MATGQRIAAIWAGPVPDGVRERIREILDGSRSGGTGLQVFFRADDIARPDAQFVRLMQLFMAHRVPLCLAVVPAWLGAAEWQGMKPFDPANAQWCWHQHGWSHTSHEPRGKKCEFGNDRSRGDIRRDLEAGRGRLKKILGSLFCPVFTPPWNRCSLATMELLGELQFQALSRYENARPIAPATLPDLAVNVDLHTRREGDGQQGWDGLFAELADAVRCGRIGFMLHHQLMNDAAFVFLDTLLTELRSRQDVSCVTFRELLAG